MKDFMERPIRSAQAFAGGFIRVNRDEVLLPNGKRAVREYLLHPGASIIVPVHEDGRVVMVRQYRHAIGAHVIEFPAGKIDPGENGEQAARRELVEETGYEAATWERLYRLHPSVASSNEANEIFLARGLKHVGRLEQDDEFLEVIEISIATALEWVRRGEITDIKAVLCLLYLAGKEGV